MSTVSLIKRALLLTLALLAPAAWAHKPSDAYLRWSLDGATLALRLDIALRDLDRELLLDANDDGALSWAEIRSRSAEIQALAEAGLGLQALAGCTPGPWQPLQIDSHSDGRYAVLQRSWQCTVAPQDLTLGYRLFAASDPTHRGVTRITAGERRETRVLVPDGQAVSLRLAAGTDAPATTAMTGLTSVFAEGVHHIWIGLDHILFLLSLLLPAVLLRRDGAWVPAPRLRPVLAEVFGVVTAFTVAHSITLALAAFDVLDPPSRAVESLIALSVLLAALNNVWPWLTAGRWKLTFAFGLIHGFGFAGALKDLGLAQGALAGPLLMFNLGVEAGQLVIVAAFVPLAWLLRKRPGYPRWVLGGGSALIALLALAWLIERMFQLKILPP